MEAEGGRKEDEDSKVEDNEQGMMESRKGGNVKLRFILRGTTVCLMCLTATSCPETWGRQMEGGLAVEQQCKKGTGRVRGRINCSARCM